MTDLDLSLADLRAEREAIRAQVRLIRIEMHKENIERAAVMLDALAAELGIQ